MSLGHNYIQGDWVKCEKGPWEGQYARVYKTRDEEGVEARIINLEKIDSTTGYSRKLRYWISAVTFLYNKNSLKDSAFEKFYNENYN